MRNIVSVTSQQRLTAKWSKANAKRRKKPRWVYSTPYTLTLLQDTYDDAIAEGHGAYLLEQDGTAAISDTKFSFYQTKRTYSKWMLGTLFLFLSFPSGSQSSLFLFCCSGERHNANLLAFSWWRNSIQHCWIWISSRIFVQTRECGIQWQESGCCHQTHLHPCCQLQVRNIVREGMLSHP